MDSGSNILNFFRNPAPKLPPKHENLEKSAKVRASGKVGKNEKSVGKQKIPEKVFLI